LLVRRSLTERVLLDALREKLRSSENFVYVFERIQEVIKSLLSSSPETIRLKRAELQAEERRIANFIEFVADGRGSRALAQALQASERKAETLRADIQQLEASREAAFEPPPLPWIEERLVRVQELLERRTQRSALLLRRVLTPLRLEPVRGRRWPPVLSGYFGSRRPRRVRAGS